MKSTDKAHLDAKETAHRTFQNIAFAYAILSDERRRRRYDATGSTSESLDHDDDFNWADFFRAQWQDTVTSSTIGSFKQNYQGSDEEKSDVFVAYEKAKGSMNRVFEEIPLSNPIDDEERFRGWIDMGIQSEDLTAYDAYVQETAASIKKRRSRAEKEAKEAEEQLRKINNKRKKDGAPENRKENRMDDLVSLIQQRQQTRASNFLEELEAKYATQSKSARRKGKGSKGKEEEPPEEAFQRTADRVQKRKAADISEDEKDATANRKPSNADEGGRAAKAVRRRVAGKVSKGGRGKKTTV